MLYNIIGYDNQVIGQVEASSQVKAWEGAREMYRGVLDVRETVKELKYPKLKGQIVTFYDSLDRWIVIGETEIPTLTGFVTKIRIRRVVPKPEIEGLAEPEDLIIS